MSKKVTAAGIFIINKEGRLLVCHPTNHKPDFWSIPKGKVETLETPKDGAIRETFEETNIDLSVYQDKLIQLDTVLYSHKKKELVPFILFEADCDGLDLSKCDIKCNSNVPSDRGGFPEMDDFQFVSLEDAKLLLHETQVACLDKITKCKEILVKS